MQSQGLRRVRSLYVGRVTLVDLEIPVYWGGEGGSLFDWSGHGHSGMNNNCYSFMQILKRVLWWMKWLECIGNGKATRAPSTGTAPLPIYRPAGAPHYHTMPQCRGARLPHYATLCHREMQGCHAATVYLSEETGIPHQLNLHVLIYDIHSWEMISTASIMFV